MFFNLKGVSKTAQDNLFENGIRNLLNSNIREKIKIDLRACVGSTNDEAKTLALQGEDEGYVLISRCQTKGKGRLGRSFFSPENTGIYMSLILRPSCKPQEAVLITTAAAVCVCRALEIVGADNPEIKWVNDIFLNGKKVCGILTEAGFGEKKDTLDYAVLGIGVNMYLPKGKFPDELQSVAGAVFESEKPDCSNKFVAEFLNIFFELYADLSEKTYVEEYRKRCFVLGKKINVISQNSETQATAVDVDENCNLIVEYPSGEKSTLSTGEISVRIANQV